MKKLLLAALLAVSLGGCATIQRSYDAVTGVSVSPTAVIVAGNSFNALQLTAANYLNFCKVRRALSVCKDYVQARAALIPAIRSGRIARDALEDFVIKNPGKLGPSGLYNALKASVTAIQGIALQYDMAGVGK